MAPPYWFGLPNQCGGGGVLPEAELLPLWVCSFLQCQIIERLRFASKERVRNHKSAPITHGTLMRGGVHYLSLGLGPHEEFYSALIKNQRHVLGCCVFIFISFFLFF